MQPRGDNASARRHQTMAALMKIAGVMTTCLPAQQAVLLDRRGGQDQEAASVPDPGSFRTGMPTRAPRKLR
jgi:hypothetical protein